MPFLPLKRYPLSCLYVHDLFVGVWQGGMLLVFVFFFLAVRLLLVT